MLNLQVMAFEDLKARVPALLEEIQSNLFEKAKKERDLHYSRVTKWEVRAEIYK